MDYLAVEQSLPELFKHYMPLSPAQSRRIASVCNALLLAGDVHLSKLARMVRGHNQQASRVRGLQRLLAAPFMSQELVYQPLLQYALASFHARRWHLVMDRTTLWRGEVDLVTISLHYHKRAIPLIWCCVPFGGAAEAVYCALIHRCLALVPATVEVVFHGDSEFGTKGIVRTLRQLDWHFMLLQPKHVHFWQRGSLHSQALATLPVTRRHSCTLAHIELFARERLGGVNLLAFYQPHYTQSGARKREICYLATSLPLNANLRRLGRRRWGTEPFFRDYKSSGWEVTRSQLCSPQRCESLLIVLALTYLWCVCMGRWLCKTGQRCWVDAKRRRHLSLFRLGWDWLVHCLRCDVPIPLLLRLYS
jgi:hypothetical protein